MNPYIKLPNVQVVNGRQELILAKCKNKCVLHLGCVDSGLLHEKFEQGELMHQKLSDAANEIWGVDIDASGNPATMCLPAASIETDPRDRWTT